MKTTLRASIIALFCVSFAIAQDTPGVNSQPGAGTVIKGKAPVAKELLKVKFPKPKSFKLKNGVTVYVLEDHRVPAVRFSLQMHAGSLYETKRGVAGMTASMLTEGTESKNYLQLAEATESIGANLDARGGTDTAVLSASGLTESTDTLIALMADVLEHPTFPADRLDRAKFQRKSMLAQRRTNPGMLLGDLSARVFYGDTPLGRESPNAEQINAITRDDLVRFHNACFRPNDAIMGVTGDVDTKSLQKKLDAAFAGWTASARTPDLALGDFRPKTATRVYLIDRPGSAQTVLQFGNLSVRRNDPDYPALVVANRILGGGSAGRLFQNIRERKGYTYGAYSSLSADHWPGIWGASASVRTEVTEPAVGEFFREFNRLQDEPVPERELADAKRSIVGSFARTLESPEGILGRTLELVQNGLPMNYWDTYPKRIEAVTPADIQRVARKYLGKSRMQLLAVGEAKRIEAGLTKYGPVEKVDPDKIGGISSGG
jgi:predicted Zn-dependent peptidase